MTSYSAKLTCKDLSRHLNKIESVVLRKAHYVLAPENDLKLTRLEMFSSLPHIMVAIAGGIARSPYVYNAQTESTLAFLAVCCIRYEKDSIVSPRVNAVRLHHVKWLFYFSNSKFHLHVERLAWTVWLHRWIPWFRIICVTGIWHWQRSFTKICHKKWHKCKFAGFLKLCFTGWWFR